MAKRLITLGFTNKPDSKRTYELETYGTPKKSRKQREMKKKTPNLCTIGINTRALLGQLGPHWSEVVINPRAYRREQTYISR